jgi:hypothetical protein
MSTMSIVTRVFAMMSPLSGIFLLSVAGGVQQFCPGSG